jgi:hypothetical protein
VLASVADEVVLALLAQGSWEDAGVLVGASRRLMETSGFRPFPQPDYDRALADAERRGTGWASAVDKGRSCSVEEVLSRLTA